jgi:hypothetical protein
VVVNELSSLGISTLDKDGLNNSKEASDLTEAKHFMTINFKLTVKVTDNETDT